MMRWLALAVALLVGVGGFVLGAGVALASPTSCATPPAAYTGSDAGVAAVTKANIDADTNCSAVTDRLDALAAQLDGTARTAHSDSGAVQATLTNIDATTVGWTARAPLNVTLPDGGSGSAVTVTNWPSVQTVGLDSTSSAAFDGQAESEHGDLWVIVGVMVGLFCAGQVLRKVWP
jgi:hypothetical protein